MRSILQIAIIVFLSHIGSFVPADAATVGLTDRYNFLTNHVPYEKRVTLLNANRFYLLFFWGRYFRIFCATGSRLMTAEQSTFMIDLHQVGMMLRYSKKRANKVISITFNIERLTPLYLDGLWCSMLLSSITRLF